jgi:hypothetical protein
MMRILSHVHIGRGVLSLSRDSQPGRRWWHWFEPSYWWPEEFLREYYGRAWWIGPWVLSWTRLDKVSPGLLGYDELPKCCTRRIVKWTLR